MNSTARTNSTRFVHILAAALGALAILLAGVATASPAEAASPTMSTTWRPWTSPTSEGPSYWSVARGTSVTMSCWTTGAKRLNTAKWFYIRSNAYPFTRCYVPANAVAHQTVVRHC